MIAGLGTANARLRELLAERDAHIAHLLAQVAQIDELQACWRSCGRRSRTWRRK